MRVKKGALGDRVHLNDLKVYVKQKEEEEEGVTLVDLLEYEQRSMKEEQGDVFSWERVGDGGTPHLEWIEEARGVG